MRQPKNMPGRANAATTPKYNPGGVTPCSRKLVSDAQVVMPETRSKNS
jgi:hypothetical protein